MKPTLQVTSLQTGSNENGFSVDARNRFLSQLKLVLVYSVDRPLPEPRVELVGLSNIFILNLKHDLLYIIYTPDETDIDKEWSYLNCQTF